MATTASVETIFNVATISTDHSAAAATLTNKSFITNTRHSFYWGVQMEREF